MVDRANEDYQLFNNETVATRKKSRYAKPDPAYQKHWTDLETQVFYDVSSYNIEVGCIYLIVIYILGTIFVWFRF